ncbi:hypothetical protein D3C72_1891650 [compost metagenome]
MAAADVSDFGAALQFVDHPGQGRQPLSHQVRAVAGTEETFGAAEHARVMVAPGQRAVTAHGCHQFVFVVVQAGNHRRTTGDIHR